MFAYVRASKYGFDLTCRNAIARDGYEWLFNYTPQEPYVELYKGGNYDPSTESQDGIELIKGDDTVWEQESLNNLAAKGELMAYEHDGFFQPMDTLRDKNLLQSLWETDSAPWKKWK